MSTLTTSENHQLATLETTIEAGLSTFREVGRALCTIRDERLYRANFDTFEAYCAARWEMSKTHANRIVAAAEVTASLTPIGAKLPKTEAQARPLVTINPPDRQPAWEAAVEEAGGKQPTAAQVQQAADKVAGRRKGTTRVAEEPDTAGPDYENESQEHEADAPSASAARVVSSRVAGNGSLSAATPKADQPFSGMDNARKVRIEGESVAPAVLKKEHASEWEMHTLHAVATRLLTEGVDAAAVVTKNYIVAVARC